MAKSQSVYIKNWTLGPYTFAIWDVFGYGFSLLDGAYRMGPV